MSKMVSKRIAVRVSCKSKRGIIGYYDITNRGVNRN